MKLNKRGMTLVETAIIVVIMVVISGFGLNYGMQYYQKTSERAAIENVERFVNDFDVSSFTGRGFGKERIKYQIAVIHDKASYIDVYYYREFFQRDGSGKVSAVPTTEFFGMRRYDFKDNNVTFKIPESFITANNLVADSVSGEAMIALRREVPHNHMQLFDAANTHMKKLDLSTAVVGDKFPLLGQGILELQKDPNPAVNETIGVPAGTVNTGLGSVTIDVLYRDTENIGTLNIDTPVRKLYFYTKYQEK